MGESVVPPLFRAAVASAGDVVGGRSVPVPVDEPASKAELLALTAEVVALQREIAQLKARLRGAGAVLGRGRPRRVGSVRPREPSPPGPGARYLPRKLAGV